MMKDWIFECDHYTRIQVITKYFISRKYIFVVETDVFTIQASNKQEFTVVVGCKSDLEKLPSLLYIFVNKKK